MFNDSDIRHPDQLDAISQETVSIGFDMPCDIKTGALLRFLASGTAGGNILELGTGTGVSTCWLLDGMDARCRLVSADKVLAKGGRIDTLCKDKVVAGVGFEPTTFGL